MEEIDKWAAEQCGVGFTTNHKKQVVAWFTGSIDERVYWEFEWTIQDCRCREIVREHFELNTQFRPALPKARVFCYSAKYDVSEAGKTIAEAEIACIKEIYKS